MNRGSYSIIGGLSFLMYISTQDWYFIIISRDDPCVRKKKNQQKFGDNQ